MLSSHPPKKINKGTQNRTTIKSWHYLDKYANDAFGVGVRANVPVANGRHRGEAEVEGGQVDGADEGAVLGIFRGQRNNLVRHPLRGAVIGRSASTK